MGYYFFPFATHSKRNDFSYLKNKKDLNQLTQAFSIIKKEKVPERVPASKENPSIADKDYEAFLDKNNPYHVLLSYKIYSEAPTIPDGEMYNDDDKKLRAYEKIFSLSYANEIAKILQTGNFEKNAREEAFLIEEYATLKPEDAIELIEARLFKTIDRINSNEVLDDNYFKLMLSMYISKINESSIDVNDRIKLLEDRITSTKLKNTLNQFKASPAQSTGTSESEPIQ